MWFSKLLPREGNFFELFDQHAERTAEGARAFMSMIQNYNDLGLREKYASEVDVAEAALKMCEEIDRLESDADRVMRAAMSRLFRDEIDTRELIKLKAIYEHLETISDRCEDVANIVEGIILENS